MKKKKQIIGRSDCDDEKSIRIDEKKTHTKKNKRKKNRTQRFARQRRPEEASASSSRSHPTGTFSIRQLRERNVQNEENDASQTLIKCVLKTINNPQKKGLENSINSTAVPAEDLVGQFFFFV